MLREKLKKLCKDRNITMKELIRQAELSDHAYTWKSSKKEPSLELLYRICDKLNISIEDFFKETDSEDKLTESDQIFIKNWKELSAPEKEMIKNAISVFSSNKKRN